MQRNIIESYLSNEKQLIEINRGEWRVLQRDGIINGM